MKRVLLVAYVFPPEPSPGALRAGYLARYLPRFGWEPVVLTHSSMEPPFSVRMAGGYGPLTAALDRLPFRVRNLLMLPDATSGWLPDALRAGLRVLRNERIDAILGTALPSSVHAVCSLLSLAGGVPWLADYRDPWAGNAYARHGKFRTRIEETLERRLLARAAGITTISDAVSSQVGGFLRRGDVQTIPNAYHPDEWASIPRPSQHGFELVFTGSMYDGQRNPDVLFAALAQLRERRDPAGAARVHFYGPNSEFVGERARRYGLAEQVTVHGVVPRTDAMHAQRGAAATLIFLSMQSAGASEMGSKFLEYLGARRPMLAFGPPGNAMAAFLERHQLGWYACDSTQAQAALARAYAHYTAGSADTQAQPDEFPTAPQLAQRFAERLDTLVARRQSALTDFTLETARGEFEWR